MPGRFTNISGNNVARFKVVTGNGRGNFYNPTPTTTTTSTTTTTTTGVQVWYTLERCDTLATDYSTNYNTGTFAINDIVVYGGALYFRVTGVNSSDPGGTHWSISATGLGSCPTTTTTTTTTTLAPVTFTAVASCNGTTAQILVNNFAGGTGTYSWIASGSSESNVLQAVNGVGGTRFSLTGLTSYTFTNLAVNTNFYIAMSDSNGTDSTPVLVTTPTACTTTTSTTTTTTTTVPTYPRWSVTACPGSTQGPTVVAVGLEVGSVYSGPLGCFTVDSAFGTSTNSPGTYTLVANCSAAQCPIP
jgi:hypothetical protein